jgi:hypothetical protein
MKTEETLLKENQMLREKLALMVSNNVADTARIAELQYDNYKLKEQINDLKATIDGLAFHNAELEEQLRYSS